MTQQERTNTVKKTGLLVLAIACFSLASPLAAIAHTSHGTTGYITTGTGTTTYGTAGTETTGVVGPYSTTYGTTEAGAYTTNNYTPDARSVGNVRANNYRTYATNGRASNWGWLGLLGLIGLAGLRSRDRDRERS